MSRVTECRCEEAHVEKVTTSRLSIFGEGEYWRAARPGNFYLAGHGFHFDTEDEARAYAFPEDPMADALADPEGRALVQAIHNRKAEG